MYDRKVVLFCLVVESVIKVSSHSDECDLNLAQVFRTPKDFSRVNFDHFEILERNNFDSSKEHPTADSENELYKTSASCPRSIANAQVMLRFGGDDIRGHNRLDAMPPCHHHPRHYCKVPYPDDVRYIPYPPCAPPVPEYFPPQYPSPYYYPFPPPPPYAFPGCYYQMSPEFRYPEYYGMPRRVMDTHKRKEKEHQHREQVPIHGKDFLEVEKRRIPNQNHPQILPPKDLSNDIVLMARQAEDTENPTPQPTEQIQNIDDSEVTEKDVGEESATEDVEVVPGESEEPQPIEKKQPSKIRKSKKAKSSGKKSVKTVQPKIVILDAIEPNHKCLKPTTSQNVDQNPPRHSSDVEVWLNSSLVPYVCKSCGKQPKLLVSYPINSNSTEDIPTGKFLEVEKCGCQSACPCCNCQRNPQTPYGKRFLVDVDSLDRVGNSQPKVLSLGHSSSLQSSFSSGYSQVGNEKPQTYYDGYRAAGSSGFYRNPNQEVHYREPTIVDIIHKPYTQPAVTHTRLEYPHIYKVVPKFEIVPKNITPLHIPDLVPTQKYICPFCQCERDHVEQRIPVETHYVPTHVVYCPYHSGPYHEEPYRLVPLHRFKRALKCNCAKCPKNQRRHGTHGLGCCAHCNKF